MNSFTFFGFELTVGQALFLLTVYYSLLLSLSGALKLRELKRIFGVLLDATKHSRSLGQVEIAEYDEFRRMVNRNSTLNSSGFQFVSVTSLALLMGVCWVEILITSPETVMVYTALGILSIVMFSRFYVRMRMFCTYLIMNKYVS